MEPRTFEMNTERQVANVVLCWKVSRVRPWVKFSVSLSNHVGFKPSLLYSCTPHSPEGIIQRRAG